MTLKLQFPNCVTIPFPYLLQKYNLENLKNYQDPENGWTYFHWIVAKQKIEALSEILEQGFKPNLLSYHHQIPEEIFNIKEKDKDKSFLFPFYTKFNALHLCSYMNKFFIASENHYSNQYAYKNIEIFEKIVEFFPETIYYKDSNDLTVTDYCFLFQDANLLNIILKTDPSFSSLHDVHIDTAIKIIDTQAARSSILRGSSKSSDILDNILEVLKKKKSFEEINHHCSKILLPEEIKKIIKI